MKVLICPLNWGLGHATRVVPIINLLLQHKFEVLIACSGNSQTYLKGEFKSTKFIDFPNYRVKYSRGHSQVLKMLFNLPELLYYSIKEHFQLKKIITDNTIHIVISDNRFGLWNKKIYSVFITHQLRVKFPGILRFLELIYQQAIKYIISKYNECWIPDLNGSYNLSGELSHVKNRIENSYFIGILSRFKRMEIQKIKYNVLFVLSGPEPQRTILENILYEQSKNTNLECAIVRGSDCKTNNKFSYPVFDIVNSEGLFDLINKSDTIICRSGYSSVMDLVILQKKAVLVPTPGQTEQEYLANYLMERGLFYAMPQKDFDLQEAINEAFEPTGKIKEIENNVLIDRVLMLKEIQNKIG